MKKDCFILIESHYFYKDQVKNILRNAQEKGYHAISIVPENLMEAYLSDVTYQVIPTADFKKETLENIIKTVQTEYNIIGLSTPLGYFCQKSETLISAEVASLAKMLNLPHNNPQALYSAHNKFLMREKLKKDGVYSVNFALLQNESDMYEQANSIGFPLIAKPVMGMASGFVSKCNNIEELKEAFLFYKDNVKEAFYDYDFTYSYDNYYFDNTKQLLLEEAIDGIEFSVELICKENSIIPLLIHEKSQLFQASHCVYENITITPPFSLTEIEKDKINQYAIEVVKCLNLKNCFCHLELRLDSKGQPSLIEVNPRRGGSRIKDNLEMSYGFIMEDIFIKQAIGSPIDEFKKKSLNEYLAISVIYPYGAGKVKSITGLTEVKENRNVIDVKRFVKDGDYINGVSEEIFAVDILHKADSSEKIIENDNAFRKIIEINIE